jgi:hypothetical protein
MYLNAEKGEANGSFAFFFAHVFDAYIKVWS